MSSDELVAGRPAPALRGLVALCHGYRQVRVAPTRHRGLPSPWLTFIVTLDEPLVVAAHPDPRQPPSRHRTLVGGLHTAPAVITTDGSQAGVQVGLHPLAARALLGLPAGELAGLDVDADAVLGAAAVELCERVSAAAGWADRFAAVEAVLLRALRAAPAPRVPAEVTHAFSQVLRSGGRVRVADLAAETGWSRRHLSEMVGREVGLSPKALARVVRFDAARRLLQTGRTGTLADLAARTGFADQAHLAREFRDLAGCPPSTWLAEELPDVQAGRAGSGAGSPS